MDRIKTRYTVATIYRLPRLTSGVEIRKLNSSSSSWPGIGRRRPNLNSTVAQKLHKLSRSKLSLRIKAVALSNGLLTIRKSVRAFARTPGLSLVLASCPHRLRAISSSLAFTRQSRNLASACRSRSPARMASMIARPVIPLTSLNTLANRIFICVIAFWIRWMCRTVRVL